MVAQQDHVGWDTEYIRETCKVQSCSTLVKVLGTYPGDANAADEGLRRTLAKVKQALAGIVTRDPNVREALRNQIPIMERWSTTRAAVDATLLQFGA